MVNYLNLDVPDNMQLCVFGDVHEHEEQFNKLMDKFENREDVILVSVGDLVEKGFGHDCAKRIVNRLRRLVDDGRAYMVRGNHELKVIRKAKKKNQMTEQLDWLDKQPLALSFVFSNGTRLTVVHGGVRPLHQWNDFKRDIEICYLREVDKDGKLVKMKSKIKNGKKISYLVDPDGKLWHNLYDGRFGYIISGHNAQKDGVPKFFNYSCNIDTACYHTGKLTAQMFDKRGKGKLHTFDGKIRFPDLEQMQRDMANGLV